MINEVPAKWNYAEGDETFPIDDAPKYLLVHVPKHDRPCVQVMQQPYKGVIVKIGALNFKEQSDGTMKMTFEFNIIDSGNHKERKLKKDKVLTQILGDIITTLMSEQIEELEAIKADGIGNHNTQESNS